MVNKSIEIVVHCFAGKLPLYADHLRFQLASLLNNNPETLVHYTLFWNSEDAHTTQVIAEIADSIGRHWYGARTPFVFNPIFLPKEQLFRRAIGRHRRSQESKCDVLWYCDVDNYFGPGAIDSVMQQVKDDGRLYFPRRTMMSKDHETGDNTLNNEEMWPTIDPAMFRKQKNFFSIGGIQILGRETAKRVGYFGFKEGEPGYNRRHTKWVQPVDPEKPFAEFRDDCAWRRTHFDMQAGLQVKIDVENLYRLRHSKSSLRPDGFPKEPLTEQK